MGDCREGLVMRGVGRAGFIRSSGKTGQEGSLKGNAQDVQDWAS